ncbi:MULTISPECIES: MFS transporter [Mesorhizobium]|uniref:MFS transporter n=1 Tax=Mesorhizobium TaxID=68287 RepID=UPI0015970C2B|nr:MULTISPECIES: MFS transporter [Mesorhizobium]
MAKNPIIKVAILVVLLVASGHFAGFICIRAFLENVPALNIETISLVLLAFGIGGFFGNLAGGFLAEHSLQAVAALPPPAHSDGRCLAADVGSIGLGLGDCGTVWAFAFGAVPVGLQNAWCCAPLPSRPKTPVG